MASSDDLSALKAALPDMDSLPPVSPAMAEALAAPEVENSVDDKNGGGAGWGRWEQTKTEVTAFIKLPKGTRGRELQARAMAPTSCSCRGWPSLLRGPSVRIAERLFLDAQMHTLVPGESAQAQLHPRHSPVAGDRP